MLAGWRRDTKKLPAWLSLDYTIRLLDLYARFLPLSAFFRLRREIPHQCSLNILLRVHSHYPHPMLWLFIIIIIFETSLALFPPFDRGRQHRRSEVVRLLLLPFTFSKFLLCFFVNIVIHGLGRGVLKQLSQLSQRKTSFALPSGSSARSHYSNF